MTQPEMGNTQERRMSRSIWFGEALKPEIMTRRITATVRLGDRTPSSSHEKGGYHPGKVVTLKIRNNDTTFDQDEYPVVVVSVEKKRLGAVVSGDLAGCPLHEQTREGLSERLASYYGSDVMDESDVTIVRFEYCDALSSLSDLLRTTLLTRASKPLHNTASFESAVGYVVPLIEHDYPAKTPVMWNAAYELLGMPFTNIMCVGNPADVRDIVAILRRDPRYLGTNVGVGFKEDVMPYLDECDPLAQAIGAVNVIARTSTGALRGYNTDGYGYAESVERLFSTRNEKLCTKQAVIVGAGGTANAVAFALAERGMRIALINRTVEKGAALVEKVNAHFNLSGDALARSFGEDAFDEAFVGADLIVNVSTKGSSGPLEKYSAFAPATTPATEENIARNVREAEQRLDALSKDVVISDVVLQKEGTPLLRAAHAKGFPTLDGVPMVVYQAVEAFFLIHRDECERRGVQKDQVTQCMWNAAFEKKQ